MLQCSFRVEFYPYLCFCGVVCISSNDVFFAVGFSERYGDVLSHYEHLLQLLTIITRNEASEAIDQVLDALGGRRGFDESLNADSNELEHLERVYAMTLKSLKEGGYQVIDSELSILLHHLC